MTPTLFLKHILLVIRFFLLSPLYIPNQRLLKLALTLTCFLTTVSARIQLAAPVNPVSGGRSTVTWTHDASDPAEFILMLQLASDSWATGQFWYFTKTKDDKLDVVFLNTDPYVISTKSIYRLTARNQSNVDQILARSPNFRFLPAGSTPSTTSTTVTTSAPTTTKSSTSAKPTITSKAVASSTTATVKTNAPITVTSSTSNAGM
ncbi:hypothetical protein EST38_g5649 [Candolleomyces aberdarensis]|uniref:Uncharacterized protein n=1 Tax=Candolleomyces aberdarensis TaxID=2316362 RepID=A0A4Q2DN65_9AGAR|nr:hypothetical protein EST38_g5649 [Candolleomyces aberdarensis]